MRTDNNFVDPPKDTKLSETTENYLKRIYILSTRMGNARISDIARTMGRSLSSTTEAVQRMSQEGLLNYEKYGKITLTKKGKELAENVHDNFETMNQLLQSIGIPPEIAIIDACSMEHSISKDTILTISDFIKFLNKRPEILDAFSKSRNQNVK